MNTYYHFSTVFHDFCLLLCVFLLDSFEIKCPGVGFYHDSSAPGVGVSHFLCAWEGGGGLGNLSFDNQKPEADILTEFLAAIYVCSLWYAEPLRA